MSQSGVSYGFSYDVYGRRTGTSVGAQMLASYSYNSRGLLSSTVYGNGTVHSLSYDESDRLISEAYNGTTAYTYSYNSDGYLGKTTDIPLGITTYYSYDLVGRVTEVNSSDGVTSEFTYNEYNSIAGYSVKQNGAEISEAEYYYNEDGLLTEIYSASEEYEYTYDSLNRITRKSHYLGGIPVRTNYSYLAGSGSNTTGLVSSISYTDNGVAKLPQLSYTYDNKGNILTVSLNGALQVSYTYDELDRLVREDNRDLNQTVTYTYDTRGNIFYKSYYSYTTGTLGSAYNTVNYTYDSVWQDKLISYDGYSFSYDSIGNPTIYKGTEVTWEKGRQLKSFNDGNTVIMSFEYNIDGLRTQKYFLYTDTTTNYLWASGLLMQQSDGTNTLNFVYAPDGTALSVNYNGSDYFYLYNLQGDVIALYNTSGSIVVRYTYDSWGKLISVTGSLANTLGKLNPFRYRGYIYDEETGFYYVSSRYYDPEICRFMNADTSDVILTTPMALTDKNLFTYCDNNPVIRADNNGEYWHFVIGGIIGGIVGGVSTALSGGDGVDITISIIAGIGSGVLSASGIGIIGQIFGSASIAMASNASQQFNSLLKNEQTEFDINNMLFDGLVSATCAAWGGNGASYGNSAGIKSSGANLTKQVFSKGKNLNKAISYYTKTAHNSSKTFVLNSLVKSQSKSSLGSSILAFKERLLEERYG